MNMDFFTDILDYLAGGGVVMIPLGIVSLWMWVLIVERMIYFRSLNYASVSFHEILSVWRGKDAPSHKGLCAGILRNFSRLRTGNAIQDKCNLRLLIMRNRPALRQNIAIIGILAGIAPLLGLLGTVTGMMTTFEVLGGFGNSNVRAMAGGLSEALLTTQTGLIVAIPGMFMAGFLNRRAAQYDQLLNNLSTSLQNYIGRSKNGGV
ncbi:MAG TPA: MotA/TolQ/ExbB proton channel family protein [Desulfocapsa sulfexigens]|nr:MotA/TolQ/ExbB proton channel family protein [Desulfocapsa sulfexigens]HIQ36948.1 MotA/TolQ/ExbB proton channel family protein [Desulfocapsa sulfexigens]